MSSWKLVTDTQPEAGKCVLLRGMCKSGYPFVGRRCKSKDGLLNEFYVPAATAPSEKYRKAYKWCEIPKDE